MKGLVARSLVGNVLGLVVAFGALIAAQTAWAQAPASEKSGAAAPSEKKLTGRLPPYYGEVVSKEQRAKIYEIQTKYNEQVMKLRVQIAALEKQLQAEVEGVLTPEQLEKVTQRMAEAKAKRSQRSAAAAGTSAPAGDAPAAATAGKSN